MPPLLNLSAQVGAGWDSGEVCGAAHGSLHGRPDVQKASGGDKQAGQILRAHDRSRVGLTNVLSDVLVGQSTLAVSDG